MTYRFFPRNSQSRNDGLVGPGHVGTLGDPRNEQSRRDGYPQNLGAEAANPFVNATIAVTGGNSLGVKSIVAGGSNLLFTLTSSQDVWQFPDTNILAAWQNGLSAGFNAGSLAFALTTAAFSVDVTGLKMNILLPAVAAYSPGAGTAFLWTVPREATRNANIGTAVASALVVTSAA